MYRPPRDPRQYRTDDEPTQRGVLAGYAAVATVLLLLWAVSQPLAGAVTVAATVGVAIVARRALRLLRCFRECGGFALDLGETVRVRITRPESRG